MRYRQPNRNPDLGEKAKVSRTKAAHGPTAVLPAYQQALAFHRLGRLEDAERLYREILAVDARHADSLHLLGVIAQQTARPALAFDLIGKAIAIRSDVAAYHVNFGTVLTQLGRLDEAIAACRRSLHLRPDDVATHFNLGNIHRDRGEPASAVASYRQAICRHPAFAEAYCNLGLIGTGDEALFRRAARLKPDLADAWATLGKALHDTGRVDAAAAHYRRALSLQPLHADALGNLARAVFKSGDDVAAERLCRRVLHLDPDNLQTRRDVGLIFKAQGRFADELAWHADVLRRHPDDAETHFNESLTRLLLGDFATGWAKYEWRWRTGGTGGRSRDFSQPRWQGEDLGGRTIVVHAEQGLGDTLQFCRYVPHVAAAGGTVILEVQPALRMLLADLPGVTRTITRLDELPPHDLHCPLMSLPLVLGGDPARFPAPAALTVKGSAAWRALLPPAAMRVGIVWQGNPDYAGDRHRSVPLAAFLPLARLPGVRLISLQKQHGLAQLDGLSDGAAVTVLGSEYTDGDFTDTAAVVAALDLVVTIDSAVAHLAGTIGRPVWVLLPAVPDWRWRLDRDDTVWYPSMRLFRQTRAGDWSDVFTRVADALTSVLPTRRRRNEVGRASVPAIRRGGHGGPPY